MYHPVSASLSRTSFPYENMVKPDKDFPNFMKPKMASENLEKPKFSQMPNQDMDPEKEYVLDCLRAY